MAVPEAVLHQLKAVILKPLKDRNCWLNILIAVNEKENTWVIFVHFTLNSWIPIRFLAQHEELNVVDQVFGDNFF